MARTDPAPLRELRDWLSQSVAEAEALLPELLDLPLPKLHLRLSTRPALRTVGVMQCLLDLAEKALGRFRRHAYELTAIAVEIVEEVVLPPQEGEIARRLRGQAWKTHARALRGIGRLEAAHEAISAARAAFAGTAANHWYLATTDSIEARILCDLGRRADALPLVRRAAEVLLAHDDLEELLKAKMTEALIVYEERGWSAVLDLWLETAPLARAHDERYVALLMYQMGLFQLRHGMAQSASLSFWFACDDFEGRGMMSEAIAARRAMADAAIQLRRPHVTVSERYMAFGQLLRTGALDDTAVVAMQILELLLPLGRTHEAASFAAKLPAVFEDRGMRAPALQAVAWLRGRADAGVLSVEDAMCVRRYFEDLFLRPNAPFEAPIQERPVREIVRGEDFESALAALGTGANLYAAMLEQRIAAAPERNPVLVGHRMRLFRARSYARYPALRIFYMFDDDAVYLMYVDLDDELAT